MPRKANTQTAEGSPKPKKIDLMKNGSFDKIELSVQERGKMQLQIDSRTTIMVSPEKCTKEYAELYKAKSQLNDLKY